MSISAYDTLLTMEEWGQIFGIAPEFLNGFDRSGRTLGTQCNSVWLQYPYMTTGDRLSRDELAYAIYTAERMITDELHYSPAPLWIEDEWIPYSRSGVVPFYGLNGKTAYAQMKSVRTRLGRVIAGGQRSTTLISSGAVVTYSKSDGNNSTYQDRATISMATTITDPCEVQVFFTTTDGAIFAAHPRYQVRPLRVTISGGIATITGDRALFVSPEFQEFQDASYTAGDTGAADSAHFVQTVDIYRVFNDTSGAEEKQGVLVWEAEPQDCPDPPCAVTTQTLCLGLRDRDLGIVQPYPSSWNATTSTYDGTSFIECREPDRVRVNYYSGVPLEVGSNGCRMNRRYAMAVARLAMTLLPKLKCGCTQAERQMQYWFDPPDNEREDFSLQSINNSFGEARGAIFAWREIARQRNGEGMLAIA